MRKILFVLFLILFSVVVIVASSRFTSNGDTVKDNATGLIWQKCSKGLSGLNCESGSVDDLIWESAITYCEGLSLGNRTDWRLPNINELKSIVDYSRYHPAINIDYFPNTIIL